MGIPINPQSFFGANSFCVGGGNSCMEISIHRATLFPFCYHLLKYLVLRWLIP